MNYVIKFVEAAMDKVELKPKNFKNFLKIFTLVTSGRLN